MRILADEEHPLYDFGLLFAQLCQVQTRTGRIVPMPEAAAFFILQQLDSVRGYPVVVVNHEWRRGVSCGVWDLSVTLLFMHVHPQAQAHQYAKLQSPARDRASR